jgi:DNA (cytosine-5)-methyltransferase 1
LFILCIHKKISQKKRNALKVYFERARTQLKRPLKYTNVLDARVPNKYQITEDLGMIFDIWDDFLSTLQHNRVEIPRFPVMAEELAGKGHLSTANCETRLGVIKKNRDFYAKYNKIIKPWLVKALRSPGFAGAKSILDYHAKHTTDAKSPISLKDCYIQMRPSGIRVNDTKYFPTLVTITSQVPIIGKFNRWMTPRECSRLQGFPQNFVLHPSDGVSYKQFGNSVNVNCVKFMLTPVTQIL